jgi:hypothetical protein
VLNSLNTLAICPPMVIDPKTLHLPSDHELENGSWVMPLLHPPASADPTPPRLGSRCSACSCSTVWTEIQGLTGRN